jgi:membrane protein DedA with SNARE-associated domain
VLDGFLADVGGLGLLWLCVLAFGLAFAETAMFLDLLVPGEVGMVVVGAAAAEADLPVPALVACAALGAIAGDTASYGLGRRFGRPLIGRFRVTRRRIGPVVDDAERHFAEHGGRSVFFARFVGALRAVVPFVAGIARLRFGTFLAWNAAASVLWAGLVITIGAVLGRSVADQVDRASTVVSGAVLLALGVWWWRRRRRTSGGVDDAGRA